MQYFDTHAHIGLIYDDPIEQLLVCQEAKQAGVTRIVSICNSLIDFKQVYDNLKTMEHVFHAAGVSPSEVQNPGKDWHRTIEEAASCLESSPWARSASTTTTNSAIARARSSFSLTSSTWRRAWISP